MWIKHDEHWCSDNQIVTVVWAVLYKRKFVFTYILLFVFRNIFIALSIAYFLPCIIVIVYFNHAIFNCSVGNTFLFVYFVINKGFYVITVCIIVLTVWCAIGQYFQTFSKLFNFHFHFYHPWLSFLAQG